MPYLIYCIMRTPVLSPGALAGVRSSTVSCLDTPRLSVAVSALAAVEKAPPVPELLAYGRVVEEFHRRQAVIPMRYGCFLEDMPAVQSLLAEREREFDALLGELAGRIEMGIRILLPEDGTTPPPAAPAADGGQYLAARRAYYRMREEGSRQHQALLDHYLQAFAGLYAKQRTETAARGNLTVLSLYFLVPQGGASRFREAFAQLVGEAGPKALLSGPWPPYNFASPDPPHGSARGRGDEPQRKGHDERAYS